MKLPATLRIGAHVIPVIVAKQPFSSETLGETNYNKGTITLDVDQKPTMLLATLLHEINHVINSEWNHEHLEFVAQSYTQIFRDNPKLIDVIRQLTKKK